MQVIGIVSDGVLAWLGMGPQNLGVQKPKAWANLEAPIKWESTPRLHRRRLEAKYTVPLRFKSLRDGFSDRHRGAYLAVLVYLGGPRWSIWALWVLPCHNMAH